MKNSNIRIWGLLTLTTILAACAPSGQPSSQRFNNEPSFDALTERTPADLRADEIETAPTANSEEDNKLADAANDAIKAKEQTRAQYSAAAEAEGTAKKEYDAQKAVSDKLAAAARRAQDAAEDAIAAAKAAEKATQTSRDNVTAKQKNLAKSQTDLANWTQKKLAAQAELTLKPKDEKIIARAKANADEEALAAKRVKANEEALKKAEAQVPVADANVPVAQAKIEPAKAAAATAKAQYEAQAVVTQQALAQWKAKVALEDRAADADKEAQNKLRDIRAKIASLNVAKAKKVADKIVYTVNEHIEAEDNYGDATSREKKAQRARDEAEGDLNARTKARGLADGRVDKMKSSWDSASEEVKSTSEAKSKAQSVFSKAEDDYKSASAVYEAKNAIAEKARNAFKAADKAKIAADAKVNSMNEQLAAVTAKVDSLNRQILQTQKEIDAAVAKKSSTDALEKKIQGLIEQRDQVIASIPGKEAALDKAQNEADQAMQARSDAEDKMIADEEPARAANLVAREKFRVLERAKTSLTVASLAAARATQKSKLLDVATTTSQSEAQRKVKAQNSSQSRLDGATARRDQAVTTLNNAKTRLSNAVDAEETLRRTIGTNAGAYEIKTAGQMSHEEEMKSFYKAAIWTRKSNANFWTDVTLAEIRANRSLMEKATDVEKFCPGYDDVSPRLKQICWLRIIGAMVFFETTLNPTESFLEPDGKVSAGLMQLSPSECSVAHSTELLKNPVLNLSCGIRMMARLIARDGKITGPEGKRGASQYWSVLRAPYESHGYKLGRLEKILPLTREYSKY